MLQCIIKTMLENETNTEPTKYLTGVDFFLVEEVESTGGAVRERKGARGEKGKRQAGGQEWGVLTRKRDVQDKEEVESLSSLLTKTSFKDEAFKMCLLLILKPITGVETVILF